MLLIFLQFLVIYTILDWRAVATAYRYLNIWNIYAQINKFILQTFHCSKQLIVYMLLRSWYLKSAFCELIWFLQLILIFDVLLKMFWLACTTYSAKIIQWTDMKMYTECKSKGLQRNPKYTHVERYAVA